MRKLRRSSFLKFSVSLTVIVIAVMAAEIRAQVKSADPQLGKSHTLPVANLATLSMSASKSSARKSATGLSSLAPDAQGPVSAALGKDDSGYWVDRSATGFCVENPRQALVVEFTQQGAEIRSHNLRWTLKTRGYGYGDALHPVKAVAPQAKANRVEYRRDGVTEWYENGPLGLEQGLTLAHPREKANGQALTVELALNGDLAAVLEPGGKTLELRGKDGEAALRYTGLEARDATGRKLRSWLEVRGERLLVRVDDGGARYPVVVDPWIQQAELTASDGKAVDLFGFSVAVSGSTLVVGAPGYVFSTATTPGAAYVFVASGGTWIQQAKLTAFDGVVSDLFGRSVAVSGSTAVVGAPRHMVGANTDQGMAYVFVRSGGTWSQQAELTASDGAAFDQFGFSVALNGSTAIVGAPGLIGQSIPASNGRAYVFVDSGGTWSQQAELTASDGKLTDLFGISVALDGSTAVVGAPEHSVGSNFRQGAAYVFVDSSGTWSQQAELTALDGAAQDLFGRSAAVSGATALVGAPNHNAAYSFVRSGGTWSQQAKLTASDAVGDFGGSVAISGSTAVVGDTEYAVGSNSNVGAAYVFVLSDGTWGQQAKLLACDGKGGNNFGTSVALDGSTAAAGAPFHQVGSNSSQGVAYVFMPTTVSLSPASLGFGFAVIDTTSAAKTVTLKNVGTAILDISNIAASANFGISNNTCGATLAANTTCKVSVTFTPTKLGSVSGTLSFSDSAPNSPQRVCLSGRGVVAATLVPTAFTYPSQAVGTTSAAKTFILTNNQTVAINGIAISTTGDFAVSATTCGTSLAAKGKCTVSVTFTPAQTGTRKGQLSVNDSASNSPQTSKLAGTGK
jgi:FG-GAP repeat protein/centrosomal CEP192-like protein